MANHDASHVATLFADVVGSTRLYEKLGDAVAHGAVEGCLAELKQITAQFGGRVVKTIGDELMAVFTNADAACCAAIEMQWRITELPPAGDEPMALRIGFHYGAAVERDQDFFGDSVNLAARLAGIAKAHQIITSAQSLENMAAHLANSARHLWPIPVKGKADPIDTFEIMWDGSSDATLSVSMQIELPRIPVRLRLLYHGEEVVVGPHQTKVSIGRDAGNEVVVDAKNASRVHARVEWRRDKFVLVDLSTNGTYVLGADAQETHLRREELILSGDGKISLGRSLSAGVRDCVEFYCEYDRAGALGPPAGQPLVHAG